MGLPGVPGPGHTVGGSPLPPGAIGCVGNPGTFTPGGRKIGCVGTPGEGHIPTPPPPPGAIGCEGCPGDGHTPGGTLIPHGGVVPPGAIGLVGNTGSPTPPPGLSSHVITP